MKELLDYRKKPISIYETKSDSANVAIFYPGFGYSLKAPIFCYLIEFFESSGFNILGIDYRYDENSDFMALSDQAQDTWFEYDSGVIGQYVLDRIDKYKKVIYIGKSLGTTMLMKQAQKGLVFTEATLIWLTPGAYVHDIYSTILEIPNKSLVVYGTADRYYKSEEVERLKDQSKVQIKELPNAEHSFEVKGNIEKSIMNLVEVVKAVEGFVGIK